jgi:hypothetical protein
MAKEPEYQYLGKKEGDEGGSTRGEGVSTIEQDAGCDQRKQYSSRKEKQDPISNLCYSKP